MSNYIKMVVVLLMPFLSSCQFNDAKQKSDIATGEEPLSKKLIPNNVSEYIKTKLSGWQIATPESWDDSSFNKYRSDSSQINYISGDFNCDKKIDYALILKDSADNFSAFTILSFDDNYYHQELENNGNTKSGKLDFGLVLLPPGAIEHSEGPPTITECAAIQKIYTNRGSKKIYYWDKKGRSIVLQFGE